MDPVEITITPLTTVHDTHPLPHQPGTQVEHRMINAGQRHRNVAGPLPTTLPPPLSSKYSPPTGSADTNHLPPAPRSPTTSGLYPASLIRAPSARHKEHPVTTAGTVARHESLLPGQPVIGVLTTCQAPPPEVLGPRHCHGEVCAEPAGGSSASVVTSAAHCAQPGARQYKQYKLCL